jgi:alanyl-tRNA synthetase
MVMVGETALGKGADAGQAVREASSIIGGGGGGKPNFAQGGGPRTDKLPEALRRAEEILRKELGSK